MAAESYSPGRESAIKFNELSSKIASIKKLQLNPTTNVIKIVAASELSDMELERKIRAKLAIHEHLDLEEAFYLETIDGFSSELPQSD